jgi:putative phosphoribosyl transferase
VCVRTPETLGAVGEWYADFQQTSDAEVRRLLADATRDRLASSAPARGR